MKIDHKNVDHNYLFASPISPALPAVVTGDDVESDIGPIVGRPGALVPHFEKSNLPALLNNTEEQRRERARAMTTLDLDVRSVSPRDMAALGL